MFNCFRWLIPTDARTSRFLQLKRENRRKNGDENTFRVVAGSLTPRPWRPLNQAALSVLGLLGNGGSVTRGREFRGLPWSTSLGLGVWADWAWALPGGPSASCGRLGAASPVPASLVSPVTMKAWKHVYSCTPLLLYQSYALACIQYVRVAQGAAHPGGNAHTNHTLQRGIIRFLEVAASPQQAPPL